MQTLRKLPIIAPKSVAMIVVNTGFMTAAAQAPDVYGIQG